jgi:hypothetical protein
MTTFRATRPLLIAALAATLTLGACSAGGAPVEPSPSLPPSAPVTDPGGGGGGNVGGGGSSGNIGTGVLPVDPGVVDPGVIDPGAGQAQLVTPRAGQLNPHPVSVAKLQTSIDGRHVLVKATWYSGVEPCNVLDSVKVDRVGNTISITLLEGTGDPNAMCIEIAVLKATIVDLGDLEPGTWTIQSPNGEAPPVTIAID